MGQLLAIITAVLLFSGMILGISAFYGDLATNYGVTNSSSLSYLSKSAETATLIESVSNESSKSLSPSDLSVFNPIPAINAVRLAASSGDILTAIVGDLSNPTNTGSSVPIPSWLSVIAITLIGLAVTAGLIRAWLKIDM